MNKQLATQDTPEVTSIMQVIGRAASDPNVDIEKMERLLNMQERVMAKQAEIAFNHALQEAQQKMPAIVRDAENKQTSSRYARLESINRRITPVYTQHGFSLSFGTADCPIDGHYRVTCLVAHREGHSREYHVDVPIDGAGMKGNANKTATHAFGSTMSYARRYLTLLIFNLSLVGEDNDGGDVLRLDDDQIATIESLITEIDPDGKKGTRQGMLAWLKVTDVERIQAAAYPDVVGMLNKKRAKG